MSARLTREEFARAIKMHRERLSLTQAEAAAVCQVSPRAWWKWEHSQGDALYSTMRGVLEILKGAKVKK